MTSRYQYAGFWIRTAASLVDSIIILLLTAPFMISYYGVDRYLKVIIYGDYGNVLYLLLMLVFPCVAFIWFWRHKQSSPGKMLFSLKVLDEESGQTLTLKQSIIRYLGYYVCLCSLFIGFVWVAFDARKQGWHDKMAKTVVVKDLQA